MGVSVAVKITFRPTTRQVIGRALFLGGVSALVALVPAVGYMLAAGHWSHLTLGGLVLVAAAVALAVAYAGARRHGVVLDERGIHPLDAQGTQPKAERYAAWTEVADIRAERRAGRTVPVVYVSDPAQKPWRLRAPTPAARSRPTPNWTRRSSSCGPSGRGTGGASRRAAPANNGIDQRHCRQAHSHPETSETFQCHRGGMRLPIVTLS
nr:hypothetical protein GCM10025732_49500 [Glycomyces mayteni]